MTQVWAFDVRDALPCVPVPLLPDDGDAVLDLPTALAAIYEEAGYDLSIDYTQAPPPPDFTGADKQWMRALLQQP